MSVINLKVKDRMGATRHLYIHSDAIGFVDYTDAEKVIHMKTGEIFWCECDAGYSGDRAGHTQIYLHQPQT